MTKLSEIKSIILKNKNPKKIKIYQSFFKTKKGEYGHGDIFYGISMSQQRKIAKQFKNISLKNIQTLLNSKIHEERMIGLLIIVEQYQRNNDIKLVKFYLKNSKKINNWDLVDVTAPKIIGNYLLNKKDRHIIYNLAKSNNLWEKRIAIVSTFTLIKNNQLKDTLKISYILLKDKNDLIHKSVGWMLREVGKKDKKLLINFLKKNYQNLPRTTLRYAIEKFSEKERKDLLSGKF